MSEKRVNIKITASTNDFNSAINKAQKEIEGLAEAIDKLSSSNIGSRLEDQFDGLPKAAQELKKQIESVLEMFNGLEKTNLDKTGDEIEDIAKASEKLGDTIADTTDAIEDVNKTKLTGFEKEVDDVIKRMEKLEGATPDDLARPFGEMGKVYEDAQKTLEKLTKAYEEAEKKQKEFAESQEQSGDNLKEFTEETKALKTQMDQMTDVMNKLNKEAQGQADVLDKQYNAYDRLSKRIKAYLENEQNGIMSREQVAKSFRDLANAMEGVYKGSNKVSLPLDDTINKTLKEAKEHLDDFNLVSLDNITDELDRLGKRLEDTIDKQKRYKAISQEFGTDGNKQAYGFKMQAEALKEWADSSNFVIQASDKLAKAWGDVSAAGEDHMKIRERSKYIDEYGKTLQENVKHIQSYYKGLKTLDEVYEKATGEERAIIDDYKAWEKNKEKLDQYNQAIRDYLTVIKESGGQISEKFLDDKGAFDVKKFIANYEKFGEANNVLKKSMEALKVKTLASVESLIQNAEANKKAAKEAVKHAEAVRDQAKEQQKAAKTTEERTEAAEKLAKAEEELAEAKKKLKNFDQDLLDDMDKLIKKFNEGAEAARKLGINMKDIAKADIGKIDGGKPFASLLDDMKTFGDDLPKSLDDFKRQVKAIFADMDGLDLGGVFDNLKGLGAGLLGKLPTELKVAAAAALALGAALKECAEIGINQFSRGMDTISGALSGLVGIARSVGTEIRDAFENITGMQLDFSSLMEIPIDFESQMAKVSAIAGATEEEFKRLEEEARRLGAETRYSATEVAEAMEYMGMAGWTVGQMVDKNEKGFSALESVLNLATVASMDLGQASDFVTDGLTALGYEAEDAADFVNILAAASTSSNTSVAQMQKAFTNCAPVAGTLGITMEDLSIALGLIADKGVKGAKAGTALKNLMANLSAPTEKQLAYIKKFNLEGAQQAIVNGDLIGGIKQMKAALKGLSPQQQNAVITTIAGKEALSGISALLNTTEGDLAELEDAIRNCDGAAQEMADTMDLTLKGHLKELASAMQETVLQVFDKTEKGIKDFTKQLTEFFHILNGFSDFGGLKGLEGALAFLENASQGWGQAIADGLSNAINAIDDFVNSESFDNLLQVGTNIINGIANGIKEAADNGTLGSAISTAIGKISTWFADNLETVIEVGKEIIDAISNGISENGDAIGEAIKAVMELQTTIDKAVAKEKWKLIGDNLVSFIIEGIESKVEVFVSALSGFFSSSMGEALSNLGEFFTSTGSTMLFDPVMALGKKIGEWIRDAILEHFNLDGVFSSIGDKISSIIPWGKDNKKSSSKKTTSKGGSKGSSKGSGSSPADTINKELSAVKPKTDATAASIGQGISDNITSKLETMDAAGLQALNAEMKSLQTTVNQLGAAMSTSFKTIQDSARTSFMGLTNIVRNQLVNVTNIMRNQMVNSANIVRNQCLNMANIFRNQFINMANITRNQMLNIANIIRNQASNARNALTSSFISMAKVVATQMNKCLSSVRNTMTQMASAASRGISMNVSGGMPAAAPANALYAANAASTYSVGGRTSALYNGASAMSTGTASGSSSRGMSEAITLEIPLYLDGKVVARETAKYVDNELKLMTKRENRKRGAK